MGKENVASSDIRSMSALPDANAQAIVPGKHASMRAVLAGNCNRWMSQHRAVSLAQRAVSLGTVTDAGQNRCTTRHLRTICQCWHVVGGMASPSISTSQHMHAVGLADDSPIAAHCSICARLQAGVTTGGKLPQLRLNHSCTAALRSCLFLFRRLRQAMCRPFI